MAKTWWLSVVLLGGCALVQPEPDPALELALACVEAGGEHPAEVVAELRQLCDPSAVRGRTPEEQRAGAARVRELTGAHP